MGGCRCSYKNCINTTKSPDNLHFFHYPVKHRDRCIVWIENACKPSFYELEEEQLRNKVVCEMHFEPQWFPNSQKKRLLQGAVPTLDGECNDINAPMSLMDTDGPAYLPSNQYCDVKVVPANEDGTVFVLDTENMFTRSAKIESYIIKNGVLVPTKSNCTTGKATKLTTSNRFLKASTSTDNTGGYLLGVEREIANINTPPGPSRPLQRGLVYHRPTYIKKEIYESSEVANNNVQKTSENTEFLVYGNGEPTFEIIPEPEDQKPNPVALSRQSQCQQTPVQGPSKFGVSKNYLRQIKQHSRDIATIKRMLKQKKTEQQKPDIKTMLNELQQHIPSSLFSVLSLMLGEKNELNEDDIEFFTTVHRASPEVYQLLSEKYKWNLPSVDVVDASSPE